MTLAKWVSENPGPYQVTLQSHHPGAKSESYTAGRIAFIVADIVFDGGVVSFINEGETAEIDLITTAFFEESVCPETGAWAAGYANFKVNVEGFYPYMIVTVQKIDNAASKEG
jgi:hypothetical protein